MFKFLLRHPGLAGGTLTVIGLIAVLLAVPSTWYSQ
jgi:hypothetical protein